MTVRHPEKINNKINPIIKKPHWIRTKITNTYNYFQTAAIINKKKTSHSLSGSELSQYF